MSSSITLESLCFPGVAERDERRRQFVTESSAAPWAKHLRPGDRIETTGPDRETVAVIVEEVCVHSGYAGLDGCGQHPNRGYDLHDSHLFEVLAAAFVALQVEPENCRPSHRGEMVVVVYRIERSTPAA